MFREHFKILIKIWALVPILTVFIPPNLSNLSFLRNYGPIFSEKTRMYVKEMFRCEEKNLKPIRSNKKKLTGALKNGTSNESQPA